MGSSVTYEDNGKDKIHYTYDSSGKLISMNLNGTEYYYVRNAQGDIIGLIDAQGEKVVSYTYDSCGKLISIEGSLKDTVGEKNPYRYRGYRYDSETGLYYLQSRYYNPEWGRFINADALVGELGSLLSHNETDAMRNYSFSKMKELGYKKWRYRRDPADETMRENEHIHLKGDGRKYQQDAFGNRRTKENTGGEPPRRAREALKKKEGWGWDKNSKKAKQIATKSVVTIGGGIRSI